MKHFPWRELLFALGFPVLLVALYAGSYYALVKPKTTMPISWEEYIASYKREPLHLVFVPVYQIGGDAAKSFYSPVHSLDRKLRPQAWNVENLLVHSSSGNFP